MREKKDFFFTGQHNGQLVLNGGAGFLPRKMHAKCTQNAGKEHAKCTLPHERMGFIGKRKQPCIKRGEKVCIVVRRAKEKREREKRNVFKHYTVDYSRER